MGAAPVGAAGKVRPVRCRKLKRVRALHVIGHVVLSERADREREAAVRRGHGRAPAGDAPCRLICLLDTRSGLPAPRTCRPDRRSRPAAAATCRFNGVRAGGGAACGRRLLRRRDRSRPCGASALRSAVISLRWAAICFCCSSIMCCMASSRLRIAASSASAGVLEREQRRAAEKKGSQFHSRAPENDEPVLLEYRARFRPAQKIEKRLGLRLSRPCQRGRIDDGWWCCRESSDDAHAFARPARPWCRRCRAAPRRAKHKRAPRAHSPRSPGDRRRCSTRPAWSARCGAYFPAGTESGSATESLPPCSAPRRSKCGAIVIDDVGAAGAIRTR